jgi:hypothetical protein
MNIYTDSKHAFATLHVQGAIYKERGLLTTERKEIKNKEKSSNCWKQSGSCLKWLLCTAGATKGAQTMSVEGTTWTTRQQEGQQKS